MADRATTDMAAEIRETPAAVARLLEREGDTLSALGHRLRALDPAVVVTAARGSSDHAAGYFKYLSEILAGVPTASVGPSVASVYHAPLKLARAAVIAVSQSGQSPDIVALQAAARIAGAFSIALVNQAGSPLAHETDAVVALHAGEERSVAATKSCLASAVALAALVAAWTQDAALGRAIATLPGALEAALASDWSVAQALLEPAPSAYLVGRGPAYPVAAEAALKLKETAVLHAEAFSGAEVMHGPLQLLQPGFPVIAFMQADASQTAMRGAVERLRQAGGRVIVVSTGDVEGADSRQGARQRSSAARSPRHAAAVLRARRGRGPGARPRSRPSQPPAQSHGDGVMPDRALCGARLFTGERFLDGHALLLERGRIVALVPADQVPEGLARDDLAGGTLAPGFIDAQVNGGGGVLFNDTPTPDGAAAIARAHGAHGSTSLLPTFITDRPELRRAAVAAVKTAIAEGRRGVRGIHLEGPFLARSRKGAHDPALICPLTDADVGALLDTGIETVLVTLAAENATPAQIRRLTEGGVIVSLGHSDASYPLAIAAAEAGARGVTHLFNAMSQLGHRAPGLVGAALDHGPLWAGIIADGHHVDPVALRIALRGKAGPGRLFLVSDAMPPAAAPGDTFTLSGRTVRRDHGRLTFDDGTLAGADLTMDAAVRFTVATLGQRLEDALRMASLYPAQFLRLDRDRGRLAPGFVADLVHLGDDLAVRQVWIDGEPVRA